MSTFALDKNYDPINFEQVSVAELEVISGGTSGSGGVYGGGCTPTWPTGTGPTYPTGFPGLPGSPGSFG